jgi:hypothetical protein
LVSEVWNNTEDILARNATRSKYGNDARRIRDIIVEITETKTTRMSKESSGQTSAPNTSSPASFGAPSRRAIRAPTDFPCVCGGMPASGWFVAMMA